MQSNLIKLFIKDTASFFSLPLSGMQIAVAKIGVGIFTQKGVRKKMNRRMLVILVAAFMLFSIPVAGYAQGGYYGGDQRANRRNRNNQSRYLRDSVRRIDRLSGQLKDDLDRSLDRSRWDGRNREDRVNDIADDFHSAAAQLKDRLDDGQNPGRAAQEARRVLDLGNRLDRIIGRQRFSRQVESKWAQIRSDLQVIRNTYSYHR